VLVAYSAHWYVGALGVRRRVHVIGTYAELAGSDPPEVAPCKLLGSYFSSWSSPASFWGLTLEKLLGELTGGLLWEASWERSGTIICSGVTWCSGVLWGPYLTSDLKTCFICFWSPFVSSLWYKFSK